MRTSAERNNHQRGDPFIDFDRAKRTARGALHYSVVLPGGAMGLLTRDFDDATELAYERVSVFTGLSVATGAPPVRVMGRAAWVEANIDSLANLMGQIELPTALAGSANAFTRTSSGVELGLMFSWLSQRVLGQYDMLGEGQQAIYYLAPNIYGIERRNGFPSEEFRRWIALHEVTHHLQFAGVPWMRDHFLDLVGRAARLGSFDQKAMTVALSRAREALARGENPLAEGGVAAMLAGPELLTVMREAQAMMSLMEGHAEYVMSRVAPDLVPSADRFARVLDDRRRHASPVARLLQQALGFEAKLRQYREGHAFLDAVVAECGEPMLARLWERPENLPTSEEISTPARWTARMTGAAHGGSSARALS